MQFKVGDKVTWTSGANGTMKTKTGTVIHVVPKGDPPHAYADGDFGLPRDHDSYIVRVGRSKNYWPRVSKLQKEEA